MALNKVNAAVTVAAKYDVSTLVDALRSQASAINALTDGNLFAQRSVSTSTSMVASDSIIMVDATGGARTVTLLPAANCINRRLRVVKTDASGNAVIVAGSGSEKVNGASSKQTTTQYASIDCVTDGSNWYATIG